MTEPKNVTPEQKDEIVKVFLAMSLKDQKRMVKELERIAEDLRK